MKKIILIFVVLQAAFPALPQNIQWAYKVLDYSSQRESKNYAAVQSLGRPNVITPGIEDFRAWEPKPDEKESYIKVGFLNPIIPKQIVIAETYHAGHISKVYIYDASGEELVIPNFKVTAGTESNYTIIKTSSITYHVYAVKIVLQHESETIGIDAIGITTSDEPVVIENEMNNPIKSNMVATRLNGNVNSVHMELGPLVSPDGKTLYFSRRGDPADVGGRKDVEDIWYSEWNDSIKGWGVAKNIGIPLNNENPNFISSISPDGNSILLGNSYDPEDDRDDGVSISHRTSEGWSMPEKLVIEDDRNISRRTDYFMANNQKVLLISNNRKGDSFGERDLYVSFLKSDNTWTKPLNLGNVINTKATEAAPFLASDDKTLYYTSDGLGGYGGSDIYMSRRLDDTWQKWSEPKNLGPIVNSSHNESFFNMSASGKEVYFTSEVEGSPNDMDMYILKLSEEFEPLPAMLVHGRVLNSKTNEPVYGVKIVFENLETGKELGFANSDYTSGKYQIVLPSGNKYGYLAEKEGFVSVHSNIELSNMKNYEEYKKDLYITPIEVGEAVVFNNVFFDFDKYNLRKESYYELDRIVKLLKKSNTMKIEISANTDNIGTEAYNDALSIKRAQAVIDYLTKESGIDKSRIVMKHNGELKPIATNNTAEGRQLNRNVSFKIISK